MALGHQKAKHTTRSDSSFETFANLHPALHPIDIMPTCKGSKPCLKPSLLSLWLTRPRKPVAERSDFLKTRTEGGRRNQVHLPRFYVFHTCSNFAVKLLFCKSNQVVHLSAKLFIKLLFTTRLQWNTSTCNYKRLRAVAFCHSDKVALKCWFYCIPALSSCFQQDQVCLFHLGVNTLLLTHYKQHYNTLVLKHPSVTTPSSYCSLSPFSPAPSFLNTESKFSLKKIIGASLLEDISLKIATSKDIGLTLLLT